MTGLFLLVTIGPILFIPLLSLLVSIKLMMMMAVLACAYYTARRYLMFNDDRCVRELVWEVNNGWTLHQGNGEVLHFVDFDNGFFSRRLIILNFKKEGASQSVLLFNDALAADTLHALRLRLQTHHHAANKQRYKVDKR